MQDSRTKNVARNIVIGLLYKIVTLILPFFSRTLMIYLLGASSVGVNTLFTSLLNFLSLAELGFGSAIVYSMYRPIAENDIDSLCALLNYYKKLYRFIGGGIFLIGIALMPFLPYLTNMETIQSVNIYILYIIYLTNSVISYFAAAYRQSLLFAYQRTDIRDKISMVVILLVRFGEILALYVNKSLYLYAFSSLIGTVSTNIASYVITKKIFPNIECRGTISIEQRKSIAKKIGGLFGTKLNSIVLHQADTLVISSFLGLTVLAKYGNYYYVQNAISSFLLIIFSSMTASIGNKIIFASAEEIYKLFRKISFLNYWIVSWCTICLLCLYQPFMKIWERLAHQELILPMSTVVWLSVCFYVYQIQRTMLIFKDAGGLWYEDRFRPYITMLFNLFSNILLVNTIGLNGVVISTVIAFLISIPWCNYTLFKYLFKMPAMKNLLEMALCTVFTIILGISTFILVNYVDCYFDNSAYSFLLIVLICFLFPNIIFVLIHYNNSEYKELSKLLKKGVNFIIWRRMEIYFNMKKNLCKRIIKSFLSRYRNRSLLRIYYKKFQKYSFVDYACTDQKQLEASIIRLYHTIEKGLSYEDYRPGFGRDNINCLLFSLKQYADHYDIHDFCYSSGVCCLKAYIEKNKLFGYEDPETEEILQSLPYIADYQTRGGSIKFLPESFESLQKFNYEKLVSTRHSIRHFSKVPVNLSLLKEAIELARYTPSACNRQEWRTIIIADKNIMRVVLENQNGNRGFGDEFDKLLLVTADLRTQQKDREIFQAFIDGGMYAQSVLNSLYFKGIGSCPLSASLTKNQEYNVRKITGVTDSEILIIFIGVGNYPDGECTTTCSQRKKVDIEIIQ